ncbi:MAG TPA: hypothetical protein QGH10_12060 [Armatimonadota bacterium]|nr:hypothetical protein [Armatimonadota bacterium]
MMGAFGLQELLLVSVLVVIHGLIIYVLIRAFGSKARRDKVEALEARVAELEDERNE